MASLSQDASAPMLARPDGNSTQKPHTKTDAPQPAPPAGSAPSSEPHPVKIPETALEWTAEQDAYLVKLKSENMPWKAISTAMDKPVSELKKRWGIVRPAGPNEKLPDDNADSAKKDLATGGGASDEGNKVKHERRVSFSEPLITPFKVWGTSKF